MEKQLMADKMRELSATAGYRKVLKEMNNLQRTFSNKRFVFLTNPNKQTIEQLQNEGFTVSKTAIVEYDQYKVLW